MNCRRQLPWLHKQGMINGIQMHWVETGDLESPLVVLLHSFPEFWYSWRNQIPALRREGFRVVAPDLRGYNLSEQAQSGFDMDTLTSDIFELIKFLQKREACIVGHGWGAVIAWSFAARFPEYTKKLVAVNAPPAPRLVECFRSCCTFSNWHLQFFLLPWIPEMIAGYNRSPTRQS